MSDGIDGMQVSIRSFEEPMRVLHIGHIAFTYKTSLNVFDFNYEGSATWRHL